MKKFKPLFLRIIFSLEIIIFCYVYLFGSQGMHTLMKMQYENNEFQKDIEVLKDEIHILEHEVEVFKSNPFYKEKIAREQLQMSHPGDEIYYIS